MLLSPVRAAQGRLLDREVLFFGGKGGVGKTTLAAAFAVLAAEQGRRTLLVSTDPAHSTGGMLDTAIGAEPTPVVDNLWAVEIDAGVEADRFIDDVKARVAEVTSPRLLPEVLRQIDAARVSPGAEEAALFERFTRLMDELGTGYDRIVFDTAPLGHTLRLLSLPEVMGGWVRGLIGRRKRVNLLERMWRTVAGSPGAPEDRDPVLEALEARRDRFRRARDLVTDARRTAFVLVTVAERLPVAETERAVRVLERHGIAVGAVVVNRLLPAVPMGSFGARRRASEAGYLTDIEERFARYRIYRVPMLDRDVWGMEVLHQVIQALPAVERRQ